MKKNKIRFMVFFTMVSTLLGLTSCQVDFIEINCEELKIRWSDSMKHTAVSWWYLGESKGYHHMIEKWPLEKKGYRLPKEALEVRMYKRHQFSWDQNKWINLKVGQLIFEEDGCILKEASMK